MGAMQSRPQLTTRIRKRKRDLILSLSLFVSPGLLHIFFLFWMVKGVGGDRVAGGQSAAADAAAGQEDLDGAAGSAMFPGHRRVSGPPPLSRLSLGLASPPVRLPALFLSLLHSKMTSHHCTLIQPLWTGPRQMTRTFIISYIALHRTPSEPVQPPRERKMNGSERE